MWADDEDDLDDEEGPEDDSGEVTSPCPYCHEPIYDDAERCPECGQYLSRVDGPGNRPLWLVAGVAVCLAIVAWWTFR